MGRSLACLCITFFIIEVSSNAVTSQLSPYLSVDPSYLQNQPEFITMEGYKQKRGRFELAFSQIGGLVMLGAGAGVGHGLYKGLQETASAGLVGKIRRTQLINYVQKRVAGTSNQLGTIAVIYSGLGCLLYWVRGSHEDSANTFVAGTLTGALYQSSGGIRSAGIGGAFGLALAGLFVAFTSRKTPEYGSHY